MKKVPPKRGKVRAGTQKRFPPMAKSCLRVKSAGEGGRWGGRKRNSSPVKCPLPKDSPGGRGSSGENAAFWFERKARCGALFIFHSGMFRQIFFRLDGVDFLKKQVDPSSRRKTRFQRRNGIYCLWLTFSFSFNYNYTDCLWNSFLGGGVIYEKNVSTECD